MKRNNEILAGIAWILLTTLSVVPACAAVPPEEAARGETPAVADDPFEKHRTAMVEQTIQARGVKDPAVLAAMRSVKRHLFVPKENRFRAYADRPLPIGDYQTISQPYIVALMTELLEPQKSDRILEIGTGSGYQAAVLAEIVDHVYSIEIIEVLGIRAKRVLGEAGYENITTKIGDGYRGWPEHAPFDGVIVTAAPDHVPEPLKQQLKVGGHLVIPVGDRMQNLLVITRTKDGFDERTVAGVRFVPMTGEARTGRKP